MLASAEQYDLSGTFDQRTVAICGIGSVLTDPAHGDESLHVSGKQVGKRVARRPPCVDAVNHDFERPTGLD